MFVTVYALRDDSGTFTEVITKILIFFLPRRLNEVNAHDKRLMHTTRL